MLTLDVWYGRSFIMLFLPMVSYACRDWGWAGWPRDGFSDERPSVCSIYHLSGQYVPLLYFLLITYLTLSIHTCEQSVIELILR